MQINQYNKNKITFSLMKFSNRIKLFSCGKNELHQKYTDYLSWIKISKLPEFQIISTIKYLTVSI
jgi:hypothetical protein